jgi:FtsP/CotA-like multicopper oxidase with cupredoxin domain
MRGVTFYVPFALRYQSVSGKRAPGTCMGQVASDRGQCIMSVSRRDMLKLGALGAVGAAGLSLPLGASVSTKSASRLASKNMPKPFQAEFVRQQALSPYQKGLNDEGKPVHYYSVTQRAGTANIVPGLTSPVYGYYGWDINLNRWVGGVPGPLIHAQQGTEVVLRMRNHLPRVNPLSGNAFKTSTHLHGSASKPQYDGYASDVTPYGFYKDYRYPNFQPARTLWYHDHGVHFTAQNAYSGLAAQYHLHDKAEAELLPLDEFDVALTVSDAMFSANGALAYDDNSHSGLWGDVILVNGVPWPTMKVKKRVYRFRILNASISRSLRPTLSNGAPLVIVGTDGGIMPKAQPVQNYRHAGAERYEVLIDFRNYKAGTKIQLRNLSNKNNVDYDFTNRIMEFVVTDDKIEDDRNNRIPDLLVDSPVMQLTPQESVKTRNMSVERKNGEWTINGKTWVDVEQSDYKLVVGDPELDDVEIWELENKSGGWFHPVHIHLIDFQIIDRNGKPPFAWERGPKDVAYVGENEKVRVLMRFEHQRGYYMMHCHNLPHEDHDMMQQFSVGMKGVEQDENDPIHADPCKVDDLPDDDS